MLCGVCDNQCVIINGRIMTNTFVHWHTQIICIFIHSSNVVALSRAYRNISRAETQKLQQQQTAAMAAAMAIATATKHRRAYAERVKNK